jgi:hypothetical protein
MQKYGFNQPLIEAIFWYRYDYQELLAVRRKLAMGKIRGYYFAL